jgi:nitrogen PTS system EIIA component
MQLVELTDPELIIPDLAGRDGEAVLRELAEHLAEVGRVRKPEPLFERLRERESLGSTALGHGVAVPHCRLQGLTRLLLAVGLSKQGVDFGAEDGQPVRVFFLMISPANAAAEHLQCLAAISKWVRGGLVPRLLELADANDIYRLIGDTAQADV